jgi:hypothetical protein
MEGDHAYGENQALAEILVADAMVNHAQYGELENIIQTF